MKYWKKDYDKLMRRTADRPVAAGRMTSSHAVFVAGVMWLLELYAFLILIFLLPY
jgi:heme O synthase-like polyprenyltransferase